MLDSIIFWIFAVVSVSAALGAITTKSNIYAALCLITVFMSIAGFYLLNNADFLALSQIIIYAVGLTIIMLFAIMFTGDNTLPVNKASRPVKIAYGIIVAYVFALLIRTVFSQNVQTFTGTNSEVANRLATEGSTGMLGELLFSQYALPFELASILLLAAMIGAIVIAKKRFEDSEDSIMGETRLPVDVASAPAPEAIEALRLKREMEYQDRKNMLKNSGSEEVQDEPPVVAPKS